MKRKRQLSLVESMLAAKSQKLASGESYSSISVEQPEQTAEEHTTITSAGEQSCLEGFLVFILLMKKKTTMQ